MKKRTFDAYVYALLIFFLAAALLPFIWMLFSSFKTNAEISQAIPTFFPERFTAKNYLAVFKKFNFLRYFANSFFVAAVKTAAAVYTSTLCGYVFAKYRFRGKEFMFGLVLATMMIPWPVTIIPMYDLMSRLRWIDSYASLVIPSLLSAFGMFMMRQFIAGIPDPLVEAAKIDGASEFYILHRIVFPLSVNAISAIAIFHFLWSWEDFLWPYLMINDEARQLLPIALKNFNGRYYTNFGGLFAATTLSILPVLCVYFVFQKQFIAGVAVAGVKE